MTPTQRSLAALRELGYLVEVVEKWNSFTRTRKDLWGWADLLAIRRGEVLAVQVTAQAVANRVAKVTDSETIGRVREAGVRVEIHGWRKNANGGFFVCFVVCVAEPKSKDSSLVSHDSTYNPADAKWQISAICF